MCSPFVLPCVALVPPLHNHTHTESQSSTKKKTLDEETKHGEDKTKTSEHKAGMQPSPHLKRVRCCSPYPHPTALMPPLP